MPKQDTPDDATVEGATVTAETTPTPEQTPTPAEGTFAELVALAAADPPCPACGAALHTERRTPDFATHHTQVCDNCGYHLKVQD